MSQVELASFVCVADEADTSFRGLVTFTGRDLSTTYATLVKSDHPDRIRAWIEDMYNPQTHAVSVAWEILQDRARAEARSRSSDYPAYLIMYNAVHMLIVNGEIPQYLISTDVLNNLHMCESSFDDWVRTALGDRYKPGVHRLIHTIALMTIQYLVGLVDPSVDGPISLFGHIMQTPSNPIYKPATKW